MSERPDPRATPPVAWQPPAGPSAPHPEAPRPSTPDPGAHDPSAHDPSAHQPSAHQPGVTQPTGPGPTASPDPSPATRRPAGRDDPGPTGRGTLGRRLVVRVVAITAVLAVLISIVSAWGTHRILRGQLDQQLDAAAARQLTASSGRFGATSPAGADILGNPVGSIFATRQADGTRRAALVRDGAVDDDAVQSAVATLLQVPPDGHKRDLTLEGLGSYRVEAQQVNGTTYVVALPLDKVNLATRALIALEAAVTLVAIGLAVILCRTAVVSSLRPLNHLVTTANEISRMDLEQGHVDLPTVGTDLGGADDEVARVGRAFTHMISNVEGALEARQASETRVRRFVADASHELRNPLASIRGYAELSQRGAEDLPETTRFALGRIQSEATRMSALVEDMLLLARLDNDQPLHLRPTDLVELVLNAVSDARAAGADHTWTLEVPDEPVEVAADPDRLMQVVVNVLSNARKHTPAGVRVDTRVSSRDGTAVVTVSDDGPGVPEAIRDSVFERFSRADVSRTGSKEGSTGLGLSIVEAVMHAHHGSADLTSGAEGTTVTLRLPLGPVPGADGDG